ncbi:MAG: transcriptional regulator [Williamsia sp.]|nr:transcriptional regulator [Williamsia sp.]
MRGKFFLIFLGCSLHFIKGEAQNTVALPGIINYPKQQYGAGTQNWKFCQDNAGIIYCANNEGLLTFDGHFWKKSLLPGSNGIRSVAMAGNGRIYVGSQGEIGFFEPGANGLLSYHSLTQLIPEDSKDFTDVWDVIPVGDEVFFRSFKKILHFKNEKILVYSDISWGFLGSCNGRLIGKAYGKGLLAFQEGRWVPFLSTNGLPEKAQVVSLIPFGRDSSLVITRKHGMYLLNGNGLTAFSTRDLQMIAEKSPYSAAVISPDRLAIATSLGGCFIVNKKGELIQRLSKQDGLQNNNVLSVFVDREKNLWLGLGNGIDFVAYNNSIKHIYADYEEHSSGRASIIYGNYLYIGTSNGLYSAPLTTQQDISLIKGDFELVAGTKGQVWNLSAVNNNLLMGHNDGFFLIKDRKAEVLDSSTGFWTFLPAASIMPSALVLAGTYNGVNFYMYDKGKFINPSVHSHFESVRFLETDGDVAWASHPYKGLYKVKMNGGIKPSYSVYKDKKGILSENNNHLFKVKSRIVLTNEKGFFEYNPQTDDFEPSAFMKAMLPAGPVQYLKEDNKGNIWFIQNKRLGVTEVSGAKGETVYFPELNDKIMGNGFEYVYPYDGNNIFVAGEEGFYHINYEEYKHNREAIPILLSNVSISNERDSTLFGGYSIPASDHTSAVKQKTPKVSYAWNSLHFEYSSPLYGKQSSVEYSYYLEDFDKTWATWSKKNERDYAYLPPGTYTFHVKARTHEREESAVVSYAFTILPPWYRTVWAYLLYLVMAGSLVYTGYRWQKRKFLAQQKKHEEERKKLEYLNQLQAGKHEEEQKQLMYLHQLELERSEKEIIRLRNERLESEIELKNTELASTTLNLIQKGEMLVKVKEEFVRMRKINEVDKESEDYKKIIRMLGEDKMKKNWEQFAVHFDRVHSNFLVTLKSRYPHLTPSELKLCAYLRLNLSSKEIAPIMNISIKSVELARYRLRKKLQMQPEENLINFLLNFHSENIS